MESDLDQNYTKAVLKYYKDIKSTDDRYFVNRELIEDAVNISKSHLKHSLCQNENLKKINTDLLSRIQKITTEIEIVESEKASALLTSQSANYLSSANQSLMNNRIDIEDKIVKFKISKAELEQKLELLQENISQ